MAKTDYTVVRNQGYGRGEFGTRERHNERKNETYHNGDICAEREHLNVRFLQRIHAADGIPATYRQTYEQMLADGTIVEKGLRKDAKVFAELVFDVNTDYFERNGGYDFAVKFYEEAYRLAVKEVGGEQYILSAVLHADERNSALSEQYGRDVYHYHLHVVYVPVVMKDVLWSKRTKDKSLIGTVKERIPQVSHSKKWPIRCKVERGDKTITFNSYSLLQDRYFEHMKAAGYDDIERGKEGSTREHLSVLDYKIQQDEKRVDALDQQIERRETQVKKLDAKLEIKQTKSATIDEINAMGKSAVFGGVHFTDDEAKRLKALARQTVKSDERMAKLKRDMSVLQTEITEVKRERDDAKRELNHWHREYTDLWNEVKDFIQLIRQFPARVKALVRELFPPKIEREREPVQQHQTKKKSYDLGR
jgi:hypothetical protein